MSDAATACELRTWYSMAEKGLNGSFPVELSLGSQIVPCGEALRHPQVPPAGLHRKNPQCFPGVFTPYSICSLTGLGLKASKYSLDRAVLIFALLIFPPKLAGFWIKHWITFCI
ncbi:Hypothetical predicted protein [Podarcis lilfordi]|uniref:Uncharacterized protein n=1 Tax=Podarcis lilfordi TaxID=74358 RepID=A0AA35QQL1_9SAUR|nr:Hypothetical predicted protein [Podarcis lilfordi]